MSVNTYLNVHDALSVIRVVFDSTIIYDPLSVSIYATIPNAERKLNWANSPSYFCFCMDRPPKAILPQTTLSFGE